MNFHPMSGVNTVKRLGFMAVCLIALFLCGNQATAQTINDVGEETAAEVQQLVKNEISALELELKDAPNGVVIDFNKGLMNYYTEVIENWDRNGDFRSELMNNVGLIISDRSNQGGGTSFSGPGQLLDGTSNDLKDYAAIVDATDVMNRANDDLPLLFDFLRTLKNQ